MNRLLLNLSTLVLFLKPQPSAFGCSTVMLATGMSRMWQASSKDGVSKLQGVPDLACSADPLTGVLQGNMELLSKALSNFWQLLVGASEKAACLVTRLHGSCN
jgi:hypothetical protein